MRRYFQTNANEKLHSELSSDIPVQLLHHKRANSEDAMNFTTVMVALLPPQQSSMIDRHEINISGRVDLYTVEN